MAIVSVFDRWLLDGSSTDLPEDAEIRSQQMAAFVQNTPINSLVTLTISLVAGIALWQNSQHNLILGWIALIWVMALGHLYRWWRKRNLTRPQRISLRGPRRATFWAFIAGITWAATAMFFTDSSDSHRLFLMIMGSAMAAGAATTMGALPAAAAAFIVSSLLPWVLLFLLQYDRDYLALACMAVIFMMGMLLSTRIVYASFLDSVRAKQANAALLAQFHTERDEWLEISGTSEAFALFDAEDHLLLWNENYRRILSLPEDSLHKGAPRADLLRSCAPPLAVERGEITREVWIEQQLCLQDRPDPSVIQELANGLWLKSSVRRTRRGHIVTLHVDVTELKAREKALRDSEARLKAFFDHSPMEMGLKDSNGRYVLVNRQFEELYGLANDEVVGKTSADLFPEEEALRLLAHDAAVLKGGLASREEVTVPTRDGERTFFAVKFPLHPSNEGDAAIGGAALDITELKQKESALRESEARLRAFFENSPVEMGLKDLDGRFVFVSRKFEELYGVANEEVVGKSASDLYPEETAAQVRAADAAVVESGQASEAEITVQTPEGLHTFLAVKFPVLDSNGDKSAIGSVAIDITERKRANEDLRRHELILKQMSDGVIITDLGGKITDWNPAAKKMFGYDRAEVLGRTTALLHHPSTPDTLTAEIISDVERYGRWAGEITCIRRNGSKLICETVVMPYQDDQGNLVATIGVNRDVTERKEAEAELERSRALLSEAVEALPDGFLVSDSEERLVLCNSRYREIYHEIAEHIVPGVALDELARKAAEHCIGLTDTEAEGWARRRIEHYRRPAGPEEHRLNDGHWIRIQDNRLPNGWIVGVRTDITELKQREQALRESEKRFQDFAESSADWFWEMDSELRFSYMSANVERITGVPPERHYGKTWEEILGEDFDDELWAEHLRTLREHKPFRDFVYPRVAEWFQGRWLRTSGVPWLDEDGAFRGYRGSGSDVTVEVEAGQALKASEEQLRVVTDSLPVLIAYIDGGERFRFVNKSCEEWFARPRDKIVGNTVKAIHPKIYDTVKPHIDMVLSGQRTSFELVVTFGDGKTRAVQMLYVPRFDHDEQVEGYFLLGEDVTERKRAEEALNERDSRLHELQRRMDHYSRISAMGQLSSALAHELNQPLTAVMNYLQAGRRLMHADGGEISAKADEMFNKAITQSARAGDVIRRLRGLFEKGETQPSTEHINDVVEDVASLALMDAKALNINYKLNLARKLPMLIIDKIQIQQVVLNLVRNAVEAFDGAEKRELVIETMRNDAGTVEVAVCDTGPGLPVKVEGNLFEPFVTGKQRGMGVGLSISDRIVKAHGGRLWAEPNPGGGTQFRFTLPLTESQMPKT